MSEIVITKDNVFTSRNVTPDFEIEEATEEWVNEWADHADTEEFVLAVGFSAKLWSILSPEQKAKLSPYQRAALEKFSDWADEFIISDYVAVDL